MKINETTLPQNYSKALYEEREFDLAKEHTDKITDILFTGVADALNELKSKEHPTAFIFQNVSGDFVAGAICQYFENEDPEKPFEGDIDLALPHNLPKSVKPPKIELTKPSTDWKTTFPVIIDDNFINQIKEKRFMARILVCKFLEHQKYESYGLNRMISWTS